MKLNEIINSGYVSLASDVAIDASDFERLIITRGAANALALQKKLEKTLDVMLMVDTAQLGNKNYSAVAVIHDRSDIMDYCIFLVFAPTLSACQQLTKRLWDASKNEETGDNGPFGPLTIDYVVYIPVEYQ